MFELSQLRCFVAVAEELHFGRAAARLNMTQPPLSRQIQILERVLDVVLLARSNRTVKLTPAGQSFLSEARRLLKLAESAALLAKRVANGKALRASSKRCRSSRRQVCQLLGFLPVMRWL